ncbi:hypothetical protein BLNAU_22083 [Blattamonas nauphoetae]|uniref:Uncharacterized protein n=1 Tax=Blattamonas nauphoetae TaxID=2049346 RepID=A0ABQ9WWB9_9EUKA|nr:hypothetical protein BLNAU_22083 [Blattamonas nauphoetae]
MTSVFSRQVLKISITDDDTPLCPRYIHLHSETPHISNIIVKCGQLGKHHQTFILQWIIRLFTTRLTPGGIVVNGGTETVLRYLDGNRDEETPIAKEGNHLPPKGINSLFDLQNASLSLQRVVVDMSSLSANQDVRCAVLASSTIVVSFCELALRTCLVVSHVGHWYPFNPGFNPTSVYPLVFLLKVFNHKIIL